jgi:hypothetical protein
MLSIDSKDWKLRYFDRVLTLMYRPTGRMRTYHGRDMLPSDQHLVAMSERKFNALCREIFDTGGRAW